MCIKPEVIEWLDESLGLNLKASDKAIENGQDEPEKVKECNKDENNYGEWEEIVEGRCFGI
jgi:hypothetical protein